MKIYIFRKLIIALIILIPAVSYSGCKKQPKCGCKGDKLLSLTDELFDYSSIHYIDSTSAYFQLGMYNTYYFCNPSEMYPKFASLASQNQILLSGDVYWNCSYLMNSSGSSYYYQYYKIYDIRITGMKTNLYGKK